MKGYVRRKGDRWYAVTYEGVDPAPGNERRTASTEAPKRHPRLATLPGSRGSGRKSDRGPDLILDDVLQESPSEATVTVPE